MERRRPRPDRGQRGQRGRRPPPGDRDKAGRPRPARRARDLPNDVVADIKATARGPRTEQALGAAEDAVRALGRNQPAEAERAASRLKSLAPRSAAARELLGLAHYHQRHFREALRELQAYRRITGRADQNHLIADCHRALGAPEKAPELAAEALGAPVSAEVKAEAVIVGGSALADLGRFEEALTLLRRFRTREDEARPHDLRVWYATGDVLERAGQRSAAAREFGRIVQHDADAFDAAERLATLS